MPLASLAANFDGQRQPRANIGQEWRGDVNSLSLSSMHAMSSAAGGADHAPDGRNGHQDDAHPRWRSSSVTAGLVEPPGTVPPNALSPSKASKLIS